MNKYFITLSLFILVSLVFALKYFSGNEVENTSVPNDFVIGKHLSIKQIFRDIKSFDGIEEETINLYGAKNEFVAFQIAFYSKNKSINKFSVDLSDLISENTKTQITKDNISTNFIGYINTESPYYGVSRIGNWPDPLLEQDEIKINKDTVQPIWVTIYIPKNTDSGLYQGNIVLNIGNLPHKIIKVFLNVWNFSIPKEIHLRTSFLLWPKYIREYHDLEKETIAYEKMLMAYYSNMLKHRLMPSENIQAFSNTIPDTRQIINNEYVDFSRYDQKIEQFLKLGQRGFDIGSLERQNKNIAKVYGKIADHLEKRGWLQYFYAYLFDETYDGVQENYSLIHKGHAGIKTLLTQPPSDQLPDVDIWCPNIKTYYQEKKKIEEFRQKGKEIWIYTAGNADTECPAHHLDVPLMESRIIPWICWKEKVQGYLFWAVNYWTKNPWENPMVYPRQNGNGTFFYPGKNGPISSIRLETLRDGMEDYEYFFVLDSLLAKIETNKSLRFSDEIINFAQEIRDIHPKVVNSVISYTLNEWELYLYRIIVGELNHYLMNIMSLKDSNSEGSELLNYIINEDLFSQIESLDERTIIFDFSQGSSVKNFTGNALKSIVVNPDNQTENQMKITLTGNKSKLECQFDPYQDWSDYDILSFEVWNHSGENINFFILLQSGDGNRWTMEVLLRHNDHRKVKFEIPGPYINKEKIKQFSLFVWKPKVKKTVFSISNIILEKKKSNKYLDLIQSFNLF